MRVVIIRPGDDFGWVAECPSLPGCVSQGQTKSEAISNIKEAIELYLEVLPEDRKDLYQEFIEPELVAV